MDEELRKQIEGLPDEDLLDMIGKKREDYTPEALEVAESAIEARGGIDYLRQKVDEEAEARIRQQEIEDQKRWDELANESFRGSLSGKRTLKDETIIEVSYHMVRHASGNSQKLIDCIQKRLSEASMPCPSRWGVIEVKTKGWISRVRRDFLVVVHDDFPDYHQYVSVRDFGIYMDCIRVFTVEPGFFKKFLAKKLAGDPDALSAPKNILKHHDLHSWNVVVRDSVRISVNELVEELGQKPGEVRSGAKTFLDIW